MAADALPRDVLALIFSRLPLEDRVNTAPCVCRAWRDAAAGQSAAWTELQVDMRGRQAFAGFLRWLRPRVPAVRHLRVRLTVDDVRPDMSRRRFRTLCESLLRTLGARLAEARQLEELSVDWQVSSGWKYSPDGRVAGSLASPVLLEALLLPVPRSRTARRRGRPLLPSLRRLELVCDSGVELAPALGLLTGLERLDVGHRSHDVWHDDGHKGGPLTAVAQRRGPRGLAAALPCCLPPSLSTLIVGSEAVVASLAECGWDALAGALPALRKLHLDIDCGYYISPASTCRLMDALRPLGGQLQVLELPAFCLPPATPAFTALRTLVVQAHLGRAGLELLGETLSALRHLETLDLEVGAPYEEEEEEEEAVWEAAVAAGGGGHRPLTDARRAKLLAALQALPASLVELRLVTERGEGMALPAGDYLRGLCRLRVGAVSALRLVPLLPAFLPQLEELTVETEIGNDAYPWLTGTTGDSALDAAAQAGADLDVARDPGAAARALAGALAGHPRFRRLCLLGINEYGCGTVCLAGTLLAMHLLRLRRGAVEVAMGLEGELSEMTL